MLGPCSEAITAACRAANLAAPVVAHVRHFLMAQWIEGCNQMCSYSNGTFLKMDVNLCALSN
jgi:hypothetical protein